MKKIKIMILQEKIIKHICSDGNVRIDGYELVPHVNIHDVDSIEVFFNVLPKHFHLKFKFREGGKLVDVIFESVTLKNMVEKLLECSLTHYTYSSYDNSYGNTCYSYNNIVMESPFDLGKFIYDIKPIMGDKQLSISDKELYNKCYTIEKRNRVATELMNVEEYGIVR